MRRLVSFLLSLSLLFSFPLPASALKPQEVRQGAGLEELDRALRSAAPRPPAAGLEEWVFIPPEHLPPDLCRDLGAYGMRAERTEYTVIRPPDGGGPALSPFAHEGAAAGIPMAQNQALGSYLFKGFGKGYKVVADGNAVFMGYHSLVDYSLRHPYEAFLILGDEGKRDLSISLEVGSIIFNGQVIPFRDMDALRAELVRLLRNGIAVRGVIGDALEVTNNFVEGGPDSWSVAAIIDLPQDVEALAELALIPDKLRRAGWIYRAPRPADDLSPFDLPAEGFRKIALANGIDPADPAAFGRWMAGQRQVTLHGGRPTLGPARSQGEELRGAHAGFQTYFPDDGDLFPGILAAMGIEVEGRRTSTDTRHGSNEAFVAETAVENVEDAHFAHTYVSPISTEQATSLTKGTGHAFVPGERGLAAGFGIKAGRLSSVDRKGTWHKGLIAMSSVSGASRELAGRLAELLKEVEFQPDAEGVGGRVTIHTFVLAQDGSAYVVRTVFRSRDLPESKEWIKLASRLPSPVPPPVEKPKRETQRLGGLVGVVAAANILAVQEDPEREVSRTYRYVLPGQLEKLMWDAGVGYHVTFLHPGQIGSGSQAEFHRTRGHFHSEPVGELVEVYDGRGSMLLWRVSSLDDPGVAVEAVRLLVKSGDIFFVPPGWAHLTLDEDPRQMLVFGTWLKTGVGLLYPPVAQVRGGPWYIGPEGIRSNSKYGAVPELAPKVPHRDYLAKSLGIPADRSVWSVGLTDRDRFKQIMGLLTMEKTPALTAEKLFTAPASPAQAPAGLEEQPGDTQADLRWLDGMPKKDLNWGIYDGIRRELILPDGDANSLTLVLARLAGLERRAQFETMQGVGEGERSPLRNFIARSFKLTRAKVERLLADLPKPVEPPRRAKPAAAVSKPAEESAAPAAEVKPAPAPGESTVIFAEPGALKVIGIVVSDPFLVDPLARLAKSIRPEPGVSVFTHVASGDDTWDTWFLSKAIGSNAAVIAVQSKSPAPAVPHLEKVVSLLQESEVPFRYVNLRADAARRIASEDELREEMAVALAEMERELKGGQEPAPAGLEEYRVVPEGAVVVPDKAPAPDENWAAAGKYQQSLTLTVKGEVPLERNQALLILSENGPVGRTKWDGQGAYLLRMGQEPRELYVYEGSSLELTLGKGPTASRPVASVRIREGAVPQEPFRNTSSDSTVLPGSEMVVRWDAAREALVVHFGWDPDQPTAYRFLPILPSEGRSSRRRTRPEPLRPQDVRILVAHSAAALIHKRVAGALRGSPIKAKDQLEAAQDLKAGRQWLENNRLAVEEDEPRHLILFTSLVDLAEAAKRVDPSARVILFAPPQPSARLTAQIDELTRKGVIDQLLNGTFTLDELKAAVKAHVRDRFSAGLEEWVRGEFELSLLEGPGAHNAVTFSGFNPLGDVCRVQVVKASPKMIGLKILVLDPQGRMVPSRVTVVRDNLLRKEWPGAVGLDFLAAPHSLDVSGTAAVQGLLNDLIRRGAPAPPTEGKTRGVSLSISRGRNERILLFDTSDESPVRWRLIGVVGGSSESQGSARLVTQFLAGISVSPASAPKEERREERTKEKPEEKPKKESARWCYAHGRDLMKIRRYAEAEELFTRAIELNGPDNPRSSRAYYDRAIARGSQRKHFLEEQDWTRVIQLRGPDSPNSITGYVYRAEVRRRLRELAGAEADVQKVLSMNPNSAGALAVLGRIREAQGRHGEAAELFRRADEISPPRFAGLEEDEEDELEAYSAWLARIEPDLNQIADAYVREDFAELKRLLDGLEIPGTLRSSQVPAVRRFLQQIDVYRLAALVMRYLSKSPGIDEVKLPASARADLEEALPMAAPLLGQGSTLGEEHRRFVRGALLEILDVLAHQRWITRERLREYLPPAKLGLPEGNIWLAFLDLASREMNAVLTSASDETLPLRDRRLEVPTAHSLAAYALVASTDAKGWLLPELTERALLYHSGRLLEMFAGGVGEHDRLPGPDEMGRMAPALASARKDLSIPLAVRSAALSDRMSIYDFLTLVREGSKMLSRMAQSMGLPRTAALLVSAGETIQKDADRFEYGLPGLSTAGMEEKEPAPVIHAARTDSSIARRFNDLRAGIYQDTLLDRMKGEAYNPFVAGYDHDEGLVNLPEIQAAFQRMRESLGSREEPIKVVQEILPQQLESFRIFLRDEREYHSSGTIRGRTDPQRAQLLGEYRDTVRRNANLSENLTLWLLDEGFEVIPYDHRDVGSWIVQDGGEVAIDEGNEWLGTAIRSRNLDRQAYTAIRRDRHGIEVVERERPDIICVGSAHALKLDLLLDRDGTRSFYALLDQHDWNLVLGLWERAHRQYRETDLSSSLEELTVPQALKRLNAFPEILRRKPGAPVSGVRPIVVDLSEDPRVGRVAQGLALMVAKYQGGDDLRFRVVATLEQAAALIAEVEPVNALAAGLLQLRVRPTREAALQDLAPGLEIAAGDAADQLEAAGILLITQLEEGVAQRILGQIELYGLSFVTDKALDAFRALIRAA